MIFGTTHDGGRPFGAVLLSRRGVLRLSIAILAAVLAGSLYGIVAATSAPDRSVSAESVREARTLHAATEVRRLAAEYRVARGKCEAKLGIERGNCRSEARAEHKRALKLVRHD